MGEFFITLQSDSSSNHFATNTITDFRNQFSPAVELEHNQYQVALVECSYYHNSIIVKKHEHLCTEKILDEKEQKYTLKKHRAETDFTSITDLMNALQFNKSNFNIKDGYAQATSIYVNQASGVYCRNLAELKHKIAKEDQNQFEKTFVIEWTPKLAGIFGLDEETNKYIYPVFQKAGASNMFIYCDIVEPQRVGHSLVPLLRRISNEGPRDTYVNREFQHLQYIDVAKPEFDHIHMYIRTESGDVPSVNVGTFTATLHFRRKRY
jgi:hypothetical protein